MKLRYLATLFISMPVFVLLGLWGMTSIPGTYNATIFFISVAIGLALSRYVTGLIRRQIIDRQTSWMFRRLPGGVWLFIGIGAFGGAVAAYLYSSASGQFLVHTMALGVGTILTVISVVVTIQVLRLEQNAGKELFMSHGGLSLE